MESESYSRGARPDVTENDLQPTANLKLYSELADWWPLLSAPEEYAEETEFYRQALVSACGIPPRTMLELGSGGGNNASHLKAHFQLTLVDLAEGMLRVSRGLNPECEHLQGDMRNVRLNRLFDVVFIQDAISYIATESDLRATLTTAFIHCRPGGAALFAPDHTRENFRPTTSHGGHDGARRSLRYLEYAWDPDPADASYVTDMVYLLRDENDQIRIEYDRHVLGLHSRELWLRLIAEVGFEPLPLPFVHSEIDPGSYEIFVGKKSLD